MEEFLNDFWQLLGIPAVWGSILTITTIVMGAIFKQLIDHALESQLEKIKELQTQDTFIRELYAESLKKYSSEQAEALRQAYLLLFEPHSSIVGTEGMKHEERLETAIQTIMRPQRKHIGWLDETTIKRINKVCHYISDFKGYPTQKMIDDKTDIYNETEEARQFLKADKIAFRLGLISRQLEERT